MDTAGLSGHCPEVQCPICTPECRLAEKQHGKEGAKDRSSVGTKPWHCVTTALVPAFSELLSAHLQNGSDSQWRYECQGPCGPSSCEWPWSPNPWPLQQQRANPGWREPASHRPRRPGTCSYHTPHLPAGCQPPLPSCKTEAAPPEPGTPAEKGQQVRLPQCLSPPVHWRN